MTTQYLCYFLSLTFEHCRLVHRLPNTTLSSDFFIDASHELALFIWNKNNGVRLRAVPYLCARKRKNCAIYGIEFPSCTKVCCICCCNCCCCMSFFCFKQFSLFFCEFFFSPFLGLCIYAAKSQFILFMFYAVGLAICK